MAAGRIHAGRHGIGRAFHVQHGSRRRPVEAPGEPFPLSERPRYTPARRSRTRSSRSFAHPSSGRAQGRGSTQQMRLTLAAVGAVVAALLQLTIVPYLRHRRRTTGSRTRVRRHLATTAGTVEAGLISAFIGGLMIDLLAPRPLGMTAFMLAGLGRCRGGARPRPRPGSTTSCPIVAVFLTSMMTSGAVSSSSTEPCATRSRSPTRFGRCCPTRSTAPPSPPSWVRSRSSSRQRAGRTGAGRVVAPAIVDERPARERQLIRFLAFGIAVADRRQRPDRAARLPAVRARRQVYQAQAEQNRTVTQALPSTRGLIYDRTGRLLVTNEPSYAIKIRPSDLPFSMRDEVVARLSALLGIDQADINVTIDCEPRVAVRPRPDRPGRADRDGQPHRRGATRPAGRRGRRRVEASLRRRPAACRRSSATRARSTPRRSRPLKDQGYQPDDLIGTGRCRVVVRVDPPRDLRPGDGRARCRRPQAPGPDDRSRGPAGRLARR